MFWIFIALKLCAIAHIIIVLVTCILDQEVLRNDKLEEIGDAIYL